VPRVSGKTLLAAGIGLAENKDEIRDETGLPFREASMKKNTPWRTAGRALMVASAALSVAAAAHADGRAAQKLGQVGLINQTLQPKPLRSPSGVANPTNPNPNSTYNANDAAKSNARNAANGANGGVPAGAYPLKPNTK
jgi:hypothetical protein